MNFWKRMFRKDNKEVVKKEEAVLPTAPVVEPKQKEITPSVPYYDYGLRYSSSIRSNEIGCTAPENTHKRVLLINALDCKERVSVFGMVCRWKETGHIEWEYSLATCFIEAVVDAIYRNSNQADITALFNCDFALGDHVFTREQVYNHIIKSFEIVEETDELLKLKLRL